MFENDQASLMAMRVGPPRSQILARVGSPGHLLAPVNVRLAYRFRPTYIFSIPEVAWVGLTEEQARTAGIDYEVGRCSFSTNPKARISSFPDGLVKLVFRATDKVLLGVYGELASELVHIGQFVMQVGDTIDRASDGSPSVE